jgi:hypothetical protein
MQKILIVRKSRLYKLFYTTLVFSRGFLDHAGNIATLLYIAFVDRNVAEIMSAQRSQRVIYVMFIKLHVKRRLLTAAIEI